MRDIGSVQMDDGCTMDRWMDLRTSWYVVEKKVSMAAGCSPAFGDPVWIYGGVSMFIQIHSPWIANAEYETPTALLLFLLMMYKKRLLQIYNSTICLKAIKFHQVCFVFESTRNIGCHNYVSTELLVTYAVKHGRRGLRSGMCELMAIDRTFADFKNHLPL